MAFQLALARSTDVSRSRRRSSLLSFGVEPTRAVRLGLQTASLLLPLLLWLLIGSAGVIDESFLPTPTAVIASLGEMARSGILFLDISASTWRVLAGFFLATVVAVPIGILMGSYPSVRALCEPLIAMLRYMPEAAFIPLLII